MLKAIDWHYTKYIEPIWVAICASQAMEFRQASAKDMMFKLIVSELS